VRRPSGRRLALATLLAVGAGLLPVEGLRGAAVAEEIPDGVWAALPVARPARPFPAPAFTLPDLAGRPFRLESLRGRLVLLYFWTTW
jgi:hypothetical protein